MGIGAAVAAVATTLAEVTVAGALEAIAITGAVLSVVGTVTKSPILSKIGMGLAVVGGVGAFATGAMGVGGTALFGPSTAASVEGDALAVSEVGSAAASGGVEAGAWDVAGAAGDVGAAAGGAASSTVPDVIGSLSGDATSVATAAGNPSVALGADPAASLADGTGTAIANTTDPAETLTLASETKDVAPWDTAVDTAAKGADGTALNANPANVYTQGAGVTPGADSTASGAAKGTWGSVNNDVNFQSGMEAGKKAIDSPGQSALGGAFGRVVDYAGDHPVVAMGVLQAGGSMLSSAFSGLTPAQINALNAQAAANDAATALVKRQAANMAMPKSVASLAPVTGTPAPLLPTPANAVTGAVGQPGFINQPKGGPQVTGVPA